MVWLFVLLSSHWYINMVGLEAQKVLKPALLTSESEAYFVMPKSGWKEVKVCPVVKEQKVFLLRDNCEFSRTRDLVLFCHCSLNRCAFA